MELDDAVGPRLQRTLGVRNIDFGQQRSCAGLQRSGDPGDLAGKTATGDFGDPYGSVYPGGQSKCGVLRHINPNAHHVALHDGEHESAACRIPLDEAADVDIPFGNHAIERRDDRRIIPLLTEHLELILLRRHIGLRDANGGLARLDRIDVDRALLLRYPTVTNQRLIPAPCHLSQIQVGFRLLQRRRELDKRRLILRDLMIQFRYSELRKKLAGLDVIADIDIALFDVAGSACIDVRIRERGGRCRQGHDDVPRTRADGRDTNARHEIANLPGGRRDRALLRIRAGRAESEPAGE